jgi:hypothetical protein
MHKYEIKKRGGRLPASGFGTKVGTCTCNCVFFPLKIYSVYQSK